MGQTSKSKDTKWVVVDGNDVRIEMDDLQEAVKLMQDLARTGPPRHVSIMPKEDYIKSDLVKTKRGKRS